MFTNSELTERDTLLQQLPLGYDKAGNMVTQHLANRDQQSTTEVTYVYDAWNRLVMVDYQGRDRSRYVYNGLNWRIVKHADTSMPPDGHLNQVREMYYSANWQLLEEQIDDFALGQNPGIDRRIEYVWGPRYIDDIIARRQNSTFGNDSPDITYEDTWYHLTDAQFSMVAITGNGAVSVADLTALNGNSGNYGVGDLNRDGIVDNDDLADSRAGRSCHREATNDRGFP